MNRAGNMMYLRTGNLFKDFTVEKRDEGTDARGRVKTEYDTNSTTTIRAVLANATPEEIERWQQEQHPITHTITQRGAPVAKEGDRFVFGSRYFYIQGIHEPGSLGIWTIYYAQERSDTHAD